MHRRDLLAAMAASPVLLGLSVARAAAEPSSQGAAR